MWKIPLEVSGIYSLFEKRTLNERFLYYIRDRKTRK